MMHYPIGVLAKNICISIILFLAYFNVKNEALSWSDLALMVEGIQVMQSWVFRSVDASCFGSISGILELILKNNRLHKNT